MGLEYFFCHSSIRSNNTRMSLNVSA